MFLGAWGVFIKDMTQIVPVSSNADVSLARFLP
jgi:hypothetical protein